MKSRVTVGAGWSFVQTLVGLALLSGCGGNPPSVSTPASPRVVGVITQSPDGCSLSATSGRIQSGLIAFTLVNDTGVAAGFDVWMIPAGHSFEEVIAHVRDERRLAEAGQPGLGHPSFFTDATPSIRAEPDLAKSSTKAGELKPGTYAVICFRTFEQVGQPRPNAVVGPVIVD